MARTLTHENIMLAVLRPLERIPPARFFWLTVLAILATRALIIAATPQYGDLIDLSIYREAGQLVLHGIDPYDFDTDASARERFRLDGRGADAYVSHTQERYDYFVASNLPGSTLLYALLEWASGGSPLGWRVALVLGDLLMAFGAYLLCRRAGLDLGRVGNKLGFLTLLVAYPSLLMWGAVVPEDKQFQIGFMLVTAALLLPVPQRAKAAGSTAALACTFALGILFKAMGAILFPALLRPLAGRTRREQVLFALVFVAVILLIVGPFSGSFVQRIARRVHTGSIEQAHHGSPWTLLPWPAAVSVLRPVAAVGALALLGFAYLRKKIDLLNALAGTLVAFICVWITNGSMDRMNIAMIFASFCLVTAAPDAWWKLALASAGFQALTYATSIALHGANSDPIETCDALNTAFFVLAYFATVSRLAPTSRPVEARATVRA
jgi:hypothetical protein